MERSVLLLDFETVDQTVQIHGRTTGTRQFCNFDNQCLDYLGVGMGSRTPESKRAVAEATNIFQSHYPELLVSVPVIKQSPGG